MDGLHSTHALFQYQWHLEWHQEKKNYYWPTFCITMFLLLEFGQIMIHFWRTVNQFLGLLPWGSLANLKKFKRKHSWQEIIFSKVNNNLLFWVFFLACINYYFHMSLLKVRYSLKSFMDPWMYAQKYISLSQRYTGSLFTYSIGLSTLHLFSSKTSAKEERSSIRIV